MNKSEFLEEYTTLEQMTGKNKRKLKRGFKTRKEALEWEQKFRLQQSSNLDMDFGSFYKIYEDDL